MVEDKKEVKVPEKVKINEQEEISPQEQRIRAITRMYYAKPAVQQALTSFAYHREAVPRYFEGFGKRPDTLQYPTDVMNLVYKGATSFHASEEIWRDPLQLSTELSQVQVAELREGWDLLIDIDSLYLDYSKIAAELIMNELEAHGIKNYGLKFSGNKGFHIILPWQAFPEEFEGVASRTMFPDWPRAMTEYLFAHIKPTYNKRLLALGVDFSAVERRTKLSKDDLLHIACPSCNVPVESHIMVQFVCDRCKTIYEKPDVKSKRRLKCTVMTCPGFFEKKGEREYSVCPKCHLSSLDKTQGSTFKITYAHAPTSFTSSFTEDFASEKLGSLDLVLVSPRHLFRMPYALHEKTALASIVLNPKKITSFTLKEADPLSLSVHPFIVPSQANEALPFLRSALAWKKQYETQTKKSRTFTSSESFEFNPEGITEEMFPPAIHKLLKGLAEGRKRGLFIIITFLRALNFSIEVIQSKVYEWNAKNQPPLKEGYVRSQLEWHAKQTRKILPPNYDHESFYKDLGLITAAPETKNPIVDVMRALKKQEKK